MAPVVFVQLCNYIAKREMVESEKGSDVGTTQHSLNVLGIVIMWKNHWVCFPSAVAQNLK